MLSFSIGAVWFASLDRLDSAHPPGNHESMLASASHDDPLTPGVHFFRIEGSRGSLGASWWAGRAPGARLSHHTLGTALVDGPLEPLLSLVVSALRTLPPARRAALVTRARFLDAQALTLLRYVETGVATREDEFPYAGATFRFEQQVWLDASGRLLVLLAREEGMTRPWVIVWEDFQNASQALLAWALRFVNQKASSALVLVLAFRGRVTAGGLEEDLWTPLLRRAEDLGLLSRLVPSPAPASVTPRVAPSNAELLQQARLARVFLAFEDSLRCYQELERRGAEPEGIVLPLERGEAFLLLGQVDRASLPLNQALDRARRARKRPLMVKALTLLCHVALLENNLAQARKYWKMAVEKEGAGTSTRDEVWYKLRVLRIVLHQAVLDESWFGAEFVELKRFYRDRGWFNTLNYLESLVPFYRFRMQTVGWQGARDEALAVLDRIHRSGNRYWESVVFHCLGFIHEVVGRQREALGWFRKAILWRQRLGDPVELIKVYNGAGYFSFTIGDFPRATRYFRQSLALLERVRDFPEICLTLFNMTLILFFSGHFASALGFLNTILEIMDSLGLEVLPWHRRAKLHALAGLCALRTGQLSLALEASDRALAEPLDTDAEPYLLLLSLLVNAGSETESTTLARFDALLERVGAESEKHLRVHLLAEKAQFLGPLRGASVFDQALVLAREGGLKDQERLLLALAQGARLEAMEGRPQRLPERTTALIAGLKSSARQEASSRLLLQTVNEVNFLRHFQTQVSAEQDADTLFRRVFELIRGQFLLRAGAVWRGVGAAVVLVQGFGTLSRRPEHQFTYQFKTSGPSSLWLVLEADADDRSLGPEQRRTLTMAFQHLDLVLELLEAREILRTAATRDRLTGLLSRQELIERIEGERKRALRHGSAPGRGLSLLFLDLDNFKTYNDTFGHAVGDAALQKFATLVLGEVRVVDVFGRYGGDEFLLMLPETDTEGALVTAQRIQTAVAAAEGFLEGLSSQLGRALSLPPDKKLGCTIGIASMAASPTADTTALISQADAALYRAKQSAKGTSAVFGET